MSSETKSVVQEFDAAVDAKRQATGMDRMRAVEAVATADPELHQRFIDATNSAGDGVGDWKGEGDAVKAFNLEIEKKMASGMDRSRALQALNSEQPELHQAFLLATNPPSAHAAIRARFARQ